ncbi:MAG TPA: hypothetical protein VED41_12210, partial [Solirubrobacteraceae bacterium]|nr:hypothetical protein [Solirubrobacteraceae bacterium]
MAARALKRARGHVFLRIAASAVLGVGAALAVAACGSSSGKLIPLAASSSLQGDFEAVAQAAETADGDCSNTEAALLKTEQDFGRLPASVDAGLRGRMQEGIAKLREDALAQCKQSSSSTSSSSTASTSTSTTKSTPTKSTPAKTQTGSTSTESQSTNTQSTNTTSTPT